MRKLNQTVAAVSLCVVVSVAVAASVTLSGKVYKLGAVNGVTVGSDAEVRIAAISAMTAAYRVSHGFNSLPRGVVVKVIYQDGSSERATVLTAFSSIQAAPLPGSQKAASVGSGGRGGGGGGSASINRGGTGVAPGGGGSRGATVTVGPISSGGSGGGGSGTVIIHRPQHNVK